MRLQAHTISAAYGSRKSTRRVGRGHGTGRGTMSGRGGKGQSARSGGGSRTALRPLRRQAQQVPKLRGFNSLVKKAATITLKDLDSKFAAKDEVTARSIAERGLAATSEYGVKIVATGKLTKALNIKGCFASKGAIAAIEAAGGKITF